MPIPTRSPRLLLLCAAVLPIITAGPACSSDEKRDSTAETIPASWEQPTLPDGTLPRVALGPWFGWRLELSGGLALINDTTEPDDPGTICSVYVAWLDGPDENPHASPDRRNRSVHNGMAFSVGYARLIDAATPLKLELKRASRMLGSAGNVVAVQEGLFVDINFAGDAGTYRHSAQLLPAVPHRRVTQAGPGPARTDWVVDDDARRPTRNVRWTTDAPLDLLNLDVQVPDPYAPNDPTRSICLITRPVTPTDLATKPDPAARK